MATFQPRRPPGVPTGGQWAPIARGSAQVLLEPDDDIVPQANSPERVILTVDAVADGCETSREIAEALGVDPRQGAYYASAAASLGLIERAGYGWWALSPDGEKAAQSSTSDLVRLLDEHLASNPHVTTFIERGEEVLAKEWGSRGDIGPETIARRVSTICSWAEYATSDDETKLARLSACRREIGERCIASKQGNGDRAHAARRTAPSATHDRCQDCGIQLPFANTSGVCEDCAGI